MKRNLISVLVVMMAVVSNASYLQWQIDQSDYSSFYKGGDVIGGNLYVVQTGSSSKSAVKIGEACSLAEAFQADVSAYQNGLYSFYVEIVNSSGAVARSDMSAETATYTSLAQSGFIVSELTETPLAQGAWHASNYGAAPEPTSALLMMMGVAFLGLKRRKA